MTRPYYCPTPAASGGGVMRRANVSGHRPERDTAPRGLAALIEPVARLLLGEPNEHLSSALKPRYRRHGSMSVDLVAGTWYEHEAGLGGGVLELIRRETGTAITRDWMAWWDRDDLIEGHARTIDIDAIRSGHEVDRAASDVDNRRRYNEAADRARRYRAPGLSADPDHHYLKRKRILPRTARRMGEAVVLLAMDLDGRIHSPWMVTNAVREARKTTPELEFRGPPGARTTAAMRGTLMKR